MHSTPSPDNQPDVTLRPVTSDTWRDVANLEVSDAQRSFVAEPLYYLALCTYGGDWHPLAITLGEQVIGFLMWAVDPTDEDCWLGGITIDRSMQRRGYGRQAVQAAIAMLTEQQPCRRFALSYRPANVVAKHLYASLGFVETDEWEDDEIVARLELVE